jgi:2-keto-4-pentenoate hydratase/2-oxohepta-3-ene-1,7-dioic acid hydratase in catechol pathway
MTTQNIRRFGRDRGGKLLFGTDRGQVRCDKLITDEDLLTFLRLDQAEQGRIIAHLLQELGERGQPWPRYDELAIPFKWLPRNLICVGKNFVEHARETQNKELVLGDDVIPTHPIFFTKAYSALTGPGSDIALASDSTSELDYEGEVGIVIGRSGKKICRDAAWDHVFGYLLLNDVSARDLQRNHKQFFLGKNLDKSSPCGPWITFKEDVPRFEDLVLKTWVNGELRQEGAMSELIFDVPSLIAILSESMELLPGDVISLGTPVGVGLGLRPPRFLQSGDSVRIQVEELGLLENRVVP